MISYYRPPKWKPWASSGGRALDANVVAVLPFRVAGADQSVQYLRQGMVDLLQAKGASMIMIAKGNRSQQVTDACRKYGGFYLGSIGGPAAVLAEENIKKVECIDFPELGMEAVWKIEVENFPAFILVDDKGNDFFRQLGL